ncbi:DGQHR domain-containing protein [Duganella fentianensis]|uniref:DGQHR domain-containing protein n=1 Tax=Duganella fentianensis TaxID=2692177 RepID=UPI0032B1E147
MSDDKIQNLDALNDLSAENFNYDAHFFRQRGNFGPSCVLFFAPVKEVLKWANVDALGHKNSGHQRERKEARVEAIAKFLRSDTSNTIPSAVIVAFSVGATKFNASTQNGKGECGILEIVGDKNSGSIVDGQHRIYGIYEFDPNMSVPIVGILDSDPVERAFQFLVINNKSSKVPATHTKALLAEMKGTKLAERLKGARVAFDAEGINDIDLVNSDLDSPFYETIDWTKTPSDKRMVPATAIELSLDYLGGLGLSEFDDRDVRRSVFLTVWKSIRFSYSDYWVKESRLISKVGIVCLTRFIIDRITNWADSDDLDINITDLDVIESQTNKIIKHMDPRFWITPWAEKAHGGFDTNQGRDRVLLAITQLYRNGKRDLPWYSEIDIIDRALAAK